ncbi:hypothetical protein ABW20_dc0102753 [Dactylellina cionopaga]|nr:hypothetical protein ABW20_dc0102753 [Dactylellina cionopaga]
MVFTNGLFQLMEKYKTDSFDKKVDLGVGAYRDNNAEPWILPVVKKADKIIRADPELNHEYLPIAGLASFTSAAAKLVLGSESPAIREKRVVSFQTISGTGACHLGALFLAKFYPRWSNQPVYLSKPTWPNHHHVLQNVGLPIAEYPYFAKDTCDLDWGGLVSTLECAETGSIILLHACAHNPTGVDLTREQWKTTADIMKARHLFPFFDTAYQGFASGDLTKDVWAIRYFVEQGFELCVAQSFAKNLGLYGQRAGCFHFVVAPSSDAEDVARRVSSQLALLTRSEISNPPIYGAMIASIVLNDEKLFEDWKRDLHTMSSRIIDMREALYNKLVELNTPGTWEHIISQIGMFSL